MTGKVYLVGAGPSECGLLTLKGYHVLQKAQVVVYDALAGDEVLGLVPKDARLIYVGKRAGRHTLPQEEINALLVREAQAGFQVVRLKGGDPFLFGRGGEELEALVQEKIPFEVVPGITSALAVPAYAGIPVTHREYSSSVHIFTAHAKKSSKSTIDYEACVRLGGTLIFLMGVASIESICGGLLAAGMTPATPAAILEQGTTARQRRISGDLSCLPQLARQADAKTPAILIVGEVCALAEKFAWAEKRPLHGRRVIITRPREKASKMAVSLRELGAEVLELPAIALDPIQPNAPLDRALGSIAQYRWLIFTSPSGVEVFLEHLKKIRFDLRCLGKLKVAAIGSATAKALENGGIFPDLVPGEFYTEALGNALAVYKEPMLIVRAREGAPGLTQALQKAAIPYTDIALYDTKYEQSPLCLQAQQLLSDGAVDAVTFTSVSTVHGFISQVSPVSPKTICAICIGRSTAQAAESYGMRVFTAQEPSIASMTQLMRSLFESKSETTW